jgi:hypothetical protein
MKAKGIFHIRLRDGPASQPCACHEFRHLFVAEPPRKRWRLDRRVVVIVTLLLILAVLYEWALRLFA